VVSLYFKNILRIFCSLVIIPNVNLTLCIVLVEIVNILLSRLSNIIVESNNKHKISRDGTNSLTDIFIFVSANFHRGWKLAGLQSFTDECARRFEGNKRNLCKGFLKHSNLIREITVALKQRIPILVIIIQQGETQHSNEVRVGIFLIPIFLCLTLSPRQKLYFCKHLELFYSQFPLFNCCLYWSVLYCQCNFPLWFSLPNLMNCKEMVSVSWKVKVSKRQHAMIF